MSATSQACRRLIEKYRETGMDEMEAIEAAIDHVSHDVVFFTRKAPNQGLLAVSKRRLEWLKDLQRRSS